jgi:hypothetical protein
VISCWFPKGAMQLLLLLLLLLHWLTSSQWAGLQA